MTHFKSRLEFRLSIARNQPLESVNEKWVKYMNDYDNLEIKTIADKIHLRESFFLYLNYKNNYGKQDKNSLNHKL